LKPVWVIVVKTVLIPAWYDVFMNDGTGKTIEEKRKDLEIQRIEVAERKKRRHRLIGVNFAKKARDDKKRASGTMFS